MHIKSHEDYFEREWPLEAASTKRFSNEHEDFF